VEGLTFLPEVSTVNALIGEFKQKHISNLVVLIHDGGTQTGSYNACVNPSGALFEYVNQLDPEVDVVISAHSHNAYNCLIGGKVVTQAMSNGRIVTDVDLTINTRSGLITGMTANNVIVTRNVPADPAMQALVDKYYNLALPIAGQVIGSITADITRSTNAAGESAIGDVLADAQLWDTSPADRGGAVMAFTNSGGIRDDLLYARLGYQEQPGEITYGEAFAVQPFYNNLVTMDLTGAQIETMLEQQWSGANQASPRVLQVSAGFTYQYSASGPAGSKVDLNTIMLNGTPLDPNATYRVTVNIYLAGGGDGFTVLQEGTNRLVGGMDIDALAFYLGANSPVAPGPQNRILLVP
jgi:5'-nucleotidase